MKIVGTAFAVILHCVRKGTEQLDTDGVFKHVSEMCVTEDQGTT